MTKEEKRNKIIRLCKRLIRLTSWYVYLTSKNKGFENIWETLDYVRHCAKLSSKVKQISQLKTELE